MLFHEIYSAYYNAVARILSRAADGGITEAEMKKICDEAAFSESFLAIIPAIREERWQLLNPDMTALLKNKPTQPLSTLQRRWLKAISLDPRVKLFGLSWDFLDDVQPLFTPEDIVVFDKYSDGDPYEDQHYIDVFRQALSAVRQRCAAEISYTTTKGERRRFRCVPQLLEYSEKDDKFRLITADNSFVNLAGIESINLVPCTHNKSNPVPTASQQRCIEAELVDERNALERAMLHFAHFQRETSRIADRKYQLKITYNAQDETELIIRVLSFGQMMRVTAPDSFVEEIRRRLIMQKNRGIK